MRKKTALTALNKLHTSTELFYFYFFIQRQSTYALFHYDVKSGKNTECNIDKISH